MSNCDVVTFPLVSWVRCALDCIDSRSLPSFLLYLRLITHVCENNWLLIKQNMASEFRPLILLVKMDYNFDNACLQKKIWTSRLPACSSIHTFGNIGSSSNMIYLCLESQKWDHNQMVINWA